MFIAVLMWQTKRMLMLMLMLLSWLLLKRKKSRHSQECPFHEYDLRTHQFVAHIRRIHPLNRDIEMVVEPMGRIVVQAANPLAALGEPLYYTHSKTNMYNDMFFMLWDSDGSNICYYVPLVYHWEQESFGQAL